MFYIVPELDLVEDGTRSLDKNYFNDVVNGFNYIMDEYGHAMNFIALSGTVEERYDTAMNAIKTLFV
jgi:hypothetical protein